MTDTYLVIIIFLLVGIYATLNPQLRFVDDDFGWWGFTSLMLLVGIFVVFVALFGSIGGLLATGALVYLIVVVLNVVDDYQRWRRRRQQSRSPEV
jgi:hypothetical protein